MVIFSKVRLGVSPDVNALATLMVLLVGTGIAVASVWMQISEPAAGARPAAARSA